MAEWLSKKQVCEILDIHNNTLERKMREKKIKFYKFGEAKSSSVKFKREDIEEYINKYLR